MKTRVQNQKGYAVDVVGGPSLAPGESAEVERTDEVAAQIGGGMLTEHKAEDKAAPKKDEARK